MTYTDIHDEKDVSNPPRQESTICNEIINLISELSYNPQSVLKKRDDDQKSSKRRQVSMCQWIHPGGDTAWSDPSRIPKCLQILLHTVLLDREDLNMLVVRHLVAVFWYLDMTDSCLGIEPRLVVVWTWWRKWGKSWVCKGEGGCFSNKQELLMKSIGDEMKRIPRDGWRWSSSVLFSCVVFKMWSSKYERWRKWRKNGEFR